MIKHNLTDEHCKCLDRVLDTIQPGLEAAKVCTDCGWDVTHLIEALKAQDEMARKAKAAFFPNRV